MTDTPMTDAERVREKHFDDMQRRESALAQAVDFHVKTGIRDGDYLRTVRAMGVETRTLSWRDVIETANAFDLFLMGQGPLVAELHFRVRAAEPEPDPEVVVVDPEVVVDADDPLAPREQEDEPPHV